MTNQKDNGYISNYIIHWTGKDGDDKGAEVLSMIASTCRLLLSYNRLHIFDINHEIHEKMVCFTDVPLAHSEQHCSQYGRFGIVFKKLSLMNVGAQPVFYASHTCKRDMDIIFKYLQEQTKTTTIEKSLFEALHRHFYYIQRLSDGQADQSNTYYYEREWRLGEQTLVLEKLNRPNTKYHCQQEGSPPYTGRLVREDDKSYFDFDKEHVAFLIAPQNYHARIKNTYKFEIMAYEDLTHGKRDRE